LSFGFVFDFDGTIVDSMGHYRRVWEDLLRESGSDEDPAAYLARSTRDNFRQLFGPDLGEEELEAHVRRQAAMSLERIRTEGAMLNEGIRELIRDLRRHGFKLAVATAAERSTVDWTLGKLALAPEFEAIVTDRDVNLGKPHPAVYVEAARRLELDPLRCAALEDSPTGVRAARDAGLYAIGLLGMHSRSALSKAGADWIVGSALELSASRVAEWIEERESR
jgi:HAD superfamily hydrolase (TIGR01509 family)